MNVKERNRSLITLWSKFLHMMCWIYRAILCCYKCRGHDFKVQTCGGRSILRESESCLWFGKPIYKFRCWVSIIETFFWNYSRRLLFFSSLDAWTLVHFWTVQETRDFEWTNNHAISIQVLKLLCCSCSLGENELPMKNFRVMSTSLIPDVGQICAGTRSGSKQQIFVSDQITLKKKAFVRDWITLLFFSRVDYVHSNRFF